ncbi:MAG: TIGR04086 family membrane protein [Bacilli bacterium]|nr:TIGR04086 family membrane protein [Mollicutes bacterium]MDY3898962.1 TIGR04086 family membrane protein [Bacilli bacterium]
MKFLKNKALSYFIFIIILAITIIIYTSLLYFGVISSNDNTVKTVSFVMGLVLFLILGLISGLKEKKSGWLAGFTSSLFLVLIVIFINIISKNLTVMSLIKYLAYVISSMLGGIIGVNIITKKGESC